MKKIEQSASCSDDGIGSTTCFEWENLHAQSSDAIRGIPETNVAPITTFGGGIPRHDQDEDIHGKREYDGRGPHAEFCSGNVKTGTSAAEYEEAKCCGKVEYVYGV